MTGEQERQGEMNEHPDAKQLAAEHFGVNLDQQTEMVVWRCPECGALEQYELELGHMARDRAFRRCNGKPEPIPVIEASAVEGVLRSNLSILESCARHLRDEGNVHYAMTVESQAQHTRDSLAALQPKGAEE